MLPLLWQLWDCLSLSRPMRFYRTSGGRVVTLEDMARELDLDLEALRWHIDQEAIPTLGVRFHGGRIISCLRLRYAVEIWRNRPSTMPLTAIPTP